MRKAVTEQNLRSIFRIADADDDLRKAVLDENLYSIARLLPDVADEFKVVNNNDRSALWRVLDKHTNSLFVKPLKSLYESDINFDKDCFSRGQLLSKKWLTDTLKELNADLGVVFLCAGWYATIVPMLVENNIRFNLIRSFDIDPTVWTIAETFNKPLLDGWKFKAQTKDIMDIDYTRNVYTTIKSNGETEELKDVPDTIVNTSCEHISNFAEWYDKIPAGKLVILQSNNYFEVDDHVNCSADLDAFSKSAVMDNVLYEGELQLEKYTRFMKIGYK